MNQADRIMMTVLIVGSAIAIVAAININGSQRQVKAWLAADACLAQAEANITSKHKKPRSEVEATHALYCIERARGIAQ